MSKVDVLVGMLVTKVTVGVGDGLTFVVVGRIVDVVVTVKNSMHLL